MTEDEWLATDDLIGMLSFVEGKVSPRKLRLFACACCRSIGQPITNAGCRAALTAAERFADGKIGAAKLKEIYVKAENDKPLFADANWAAASTAYPVAMDAAIETIQRVSAVATKTDASDAYSKALAAECVGAPPAARRAAWQFYEAAAAASLTRLRQQHVWLLRDIVGDPFREQFLNSMSCWNSETLVADARTVYRKRSVGDLVQLGDLLVESGCDDSEMIDHCYAPFRHVRGCWVIDAILGKE